MVGEGQAQPGLGVGRLPLGNRTRVVGVMGHPVGHSRSPAMHNAAFAALDLDWCYLAFEVAPPDLMRALAGAHALGFAGLNVTAPHKARAAENVDRLEGAARTVGIANTIVFHPKGATGYSTDGEGFVAGARDHGVDPGSGTHAVIIGAGSTGVCVAQALLERGARVALVNRARDRLEQALTRLQGIPGLGGGALSGIGLEEEGVGEALAAADLLVNTVPPGRGTPTLELAALRPDAAVCDVSYEPARTPFLTAAADAGCHRLWNGLAMLVYQGAASFGLWTGLPAPLEVMARSVGYEPPPSAKARHRPPPTGAGA